MISIRIDDAVGNNPVLHNPHQRLAFRIPNHFGVNLTTAIPLLPGKYSVGGWAHKSSKGDGTYPDVEFEVNEGDDKEVIIKLKPN
jgi:hypothetical protein